MWANHLRGHMPGLTKFCGGAAMIGMDEVKPGWWDMAAKLVRMFEGLHLVPYVCPAGVRTVGYGRAYWTGGPITEAEAVALLSEDLRTAARWLEGLEGLSDCQKAALVSLVFNIGGGPFMGSTLRRHLEAGEHEAAAREFARWVYGGGQKLPGLERRRSIEQRVFRGESCVIF